MVVTGAGVVIRNNLIGIKTENVSYGLMVRMKILMDRIRVDFTDPLSGIAQLLEVLELSIAFPVGVDLAGDPRGPAARLLAKCLCGCIVDCYPVAMK